MIHALALSDLARRYTESRSMSEDYAERLKSRALALENHSGEQALALALTEARVNAFLASIEHLAPRTVRSYREDLLTLWNSAADDGFTPYPVPRRIRRVRLPDLLIDCYTTSEARALLAYARTLRGVYPNGVERAAYWTAAIPLAWDAGFRRGDVWRFQRDAVRPDRTMQLVQHKSQKIVTVRLRESTVAALDAIGLARPLVWSHDKSWFGRHFKRIVRGSGVNRGTFKWLRRASGSYVEAIQAGAGYKHLGNTPIVFSRHYDAKLGAATLPMPPEL